MTWSAAEVDERLEMAMEKQDAALANLLELGVLKDQTDTAYERAKRDAYTSGRVTGRNDAERRAALLAVQVKPGTTILDLRHQRDRAKTGYFDARRVIDKLEKDIDVLQTLHVTHRNASASGPRR